jgi:hypothetical protein
VAFESKGLRNQEITFQFQGLKETKWFQQSDGSNLYKPPTSPGGKSTASRRLPLPKVASMCCLSAAPLLPTGAFFLGLLCGLFWQKEGVRIIR